MGTGHGIIIGSIDVDGTGRKLDIVKTLRSAKEGSSGSSVSNGNSGGLGEGDGDGIDLVSESSF